jgi:hypothetical protein
MVASQSGIHCRQIAEADVNAVAALLSRGFPKSDGRFWQRALARLTRREPPAGLPKYGYLLESGGMPVGALLVICSAVHAGGKPIPRCNLSSWYVEPAFRSYATLLVSRALANREVTYLNVSPSPHTWPIIEAQGFSRYCEGVFVAVPVLKGLFAGAGDVRVFGAQTRPQVDFDPSDEEILKQHADLGCISLWCATSERAYPFVFRPRRAKGIVPCAQLIYCRDEADFVRFAGPIGRALARRGLFLTVLDANGRIPGLIGIFRRDRLPKYFKGPHRPRLGDLAYTEQAVIGV